MDADDLYGLPLDRFVPERTALARSLRGDGRREEAAEVAALRKPTVAAWAVNQLVRSQRRGVAELFDSGDQLLAAHRDALTGGGDAGVLRAATERERADVDALVGAARGLLTSGGHELSGAVIDRVAETLHAAAMDQEAREQARGGRLVRELRHVGLGVLAPGGPAPAAVKRPTRERRSRPEGAAPGRGRARAAAAERGARARAVRAAETARRHVDRADRAVARAQQRRDQAAKELRDAEQALSSARSDADVAARAHRRAQKELDAT